MNQQVNDRLNNNQERTGRNRRSCFRRAKGVLRLGLGLTGPVLRRNLNALVFRLFDVDPAVSFEIGNRLHACKPAVNRTAYSSICDELLDTGLGTCPLIHPN